MKERSKVKEGREGMCFDCPGIWTQGLTLTKQVVYYTPRPFFFSLFL
jgi:hypothetical protein